MRKRSEYLEHNIPVKRTLFAKKNASRSLGRLNRMARSAVHDPKSFEAFFEEGARILNQYLSDKLNLSPQGLTQDAVEHQPQERQADSSTIQKIRECYEICDMVRFGRLNPQGIDCGSMIKRIREIIEIVERLCS